MLRIFLSYAHADLAQARRLWEILNLIPAVDVWFDKESLLPGQAWKTEIRTAIGDSDFFLLLLSQKSVTKQGFYQREVRRALEILEEHPPGEIYLIPVRLDDCHLHFDELKALQYVDLFPDWNAGVDRILRVLRTHRRSPFIAPDQVSQAKVRFTSHQARFVAGPELFYFLTVANTSGSPLEITHVWYEDSDHHVPVRRSSRPLPKRLEVSESWSTWISLHDLPERSRTNAYDCFRLRLSLGDIIASRKEDSVPPYGSVPGGRVLQEDLTSPHESGGSSEGNAHRAEGAEPPNPADRAGGRRQGS